jgi:hypothetical protein
MSAAAPLLYLYLHPSQLRVLERLIAFDPGARLLGRQMIVSLDDRGAEEVLAECRRLGVRVLGSRVETGGPEVD